MSVRRLTRLAGVVAAAAALTVAVGVTAVAASAPAPAEPTDQEVIAVPFSALKRGELKYNVVIQPQDMKQALSSTLF